MVTSRMLASMIFGLKTLVERDGGRGAGEEDEEPEGFSRPRWPLWCMLLGQRRAQTVFWTTGETSWGRRGPAVRCAGSGWSLLVWGASPGG